MENKEIVKTVAIAFSQFLEDDCFFSFKGYMMYDGDKNEYELDELYDYWIDNVYFKTQPK